ncbi:3-hydroxyacyl-CoA dehydrogenase [Flagellimonas meridianipacifica]|uniref:3-hydroxybutyryl-CoA dehydrogenase n=1 Tax=Flagellimonas meridianipacifica TaxID=1080225 RepID=A0A2T0MIX4_9FLAO|nr:3-hydroxyacyl-CoA dehydrogenase [Allomuricauda pacifica]PRX57505.1 3-hydroxybutyryl-CoA dehydrogenase [Allomuricauda pacifica]
MKYKNVTIAGGGILGSQIAFHTAFHGFSVTVYDISDSALKNCKERMTLWQKFYQKDLGISNDQLQKIYKSIAFKIDLKSAVSEADLVIEAIPENIKIKSDFYEKLNQFAPSHTDFATNSSSLLPSYFAKDTGRPEQFIALHFANRIWIRNTAEIMGHSKTSPKLFDDMILFAKAIGMVAIPVKKEQPGYVLNSLLMPLLRAGLNLWANDVAEPHLIDKTWMIATGAPNGPFATLDTVGLKTSLNITKAHLNENSDIETTKRIISKLEGMVAEGKLGTASGQGFYKYPNPEFLEDDFLK